MVKNPFSLEGKVILVTGASSGIGRACAVACAEAGASVVLTGRDETRLEETFRMLPRPLGAFTAKCVADLSDEEGLDLLVQSVPELNGLVLCAGKCETRPLAFLNRKRMFDMLNINFLASALLVQKLTKTKKLVNGGSIVFISSIDGPRTVHIGNSNYAASKGALSSFMKGTALELAPQKIRANAILPGMTETPLIHSSSITEEQLNADRSNYPLQRYGKPEEIAYAAVYLLSDAAAWTTGTELVIDGGFTLS